MKEHPNYRPFYLSNDSKTLIVLLLLLWKSQTLIKLIDERGKETWSKVQEHFDVTLEFHPANCYSVDSKGNKATIYVSENNYNPNYFAHEILHLYIRIYGSNIRETLFANIFLSDSLTSILNHKVIDILTNSLEHLKIYPLYIERKFDEKLFVLTYNQKLAKHYDIQRIVSELEGNIVSSKDAASNYISIFFSMNADSNPQIDYSELFELLKKGDGILCSILDCFWLDWVKHDFVKGAENLASIVQKFYKALSGWLEAKYNSYN